MLGCIKPGSLPFSYFLKHACIPSNVLAMARSLKVYTYVFKLVYRFFLKWVLLYQKNPLALWLQGNDYVPYTTYIALDMFYIYMF